MRRFYARLVLPFAAPLLLLTACASREERAALAAAQAEQLFQSGDLVNARIKTMEAIGARDDLPQLWGLLGRIEVAARNFGGAYNAYSRMNELDAGNLEALALVMEISFLAGRYDDTDRYADEMLSLNPGNVRALILKGGVARERRRFDEALRLAEQALTADPGNEDARILKARAMAGAKQPAEAAAYLEAELKLRGDSVASLRELVGLYEGLGQPDAVDRTYGRLLQLEPDNPALKREVAAELLRRGEDARALVLIEAILAAKPDDYGTVLPIVDMLLATGRDPLPPGWIARVAEGGAAERSGFARYAIRQGRPRDALALLAPMQGPDTIGYANVEAQILVAEAEAALGQTAAARARVDRVTSFDPTNPRGLALRARLRTAAGELDDALVDAQVLVRDNPQSAEARIILAEVYARRGDMRLANSKFREGYRALPADGQMLSAYSRFLLDQDRRLDAVRLVQDFTRDNPGDPRGWRIQASVCREAATPSCATAAQQALGAIVTGSEG